LRIHVFLAKYTDISRREAEKLVIAGRVIIDGEVASVGQKVEGDEVVLLNNKRVYKQDQKDMLLALHKPEGYECSTQAQSGQSIYDLLPDLSQGKWILVGRLDLNTSGLILVTNNGVLANQLAHPSNGLDREYLVRVNGKLTQEEMSMLISGVMLDDGFARCEKIVLNQSSKGVNTWYKMIMAEGRNRIVRRLMAYMDKDISRLIRIRFGPIKLEKALPVGHYEYIDVDKIKSMIQ